MSSTSSHSSSTPVTSPLPPTGTATEPPAGRSADIAELLELRSFDGSANPGVSLPVHPRSCQWVEIPCVSGLASVSSQVR